MGERISTEYETRLFAAIYKAVDGVFDKDDILEEYQAHIGNETVALAVSAAISVFKAVFEAQKSAVENGVLKEV